MGLDLVCGAVLQRFGSYSSLHMFRYQWIEAEACRQERRGCHEVAAHMREILYGDRFIDYETFVERRDIPWLPGTRALIDHSDCDGEWSPVEARMILKAHHLLGIVHSPLVSILCHSVTTNQCIEFM